MKAIQCNKRLVRQRTASLGRRIAIFVFLPCLLSLGAACAPRPEVEKSSKNGVLKNDVFMYSQAKMASRIEVHYSDWQPFRPFAIEEKALRDNEWDYNVIIRFHSLDLDRLRRALAETKARPLDKTPHDFTLACDIELIGENRYSETLHLSFAKYPVSVRINGEFFKPSKDLLLLMSEFLPCDAGRIWMEMEPSLEGQMGANRDGPY